MELLIFSLKKKFLLNLGKGIFRTLAFLKLGAYSELEEHCQRSMMERFGKIPGALFNTKLEK